MSQKRAKNLEPGFEGSFSPSSAAVIPTEAGAIGSAARGAPVGNDAILPARSTATGVRRVGESEFPPAEGETARFAEASLAYSSETGFSDESLVLDAWYACHASPATRALVLRAKLRAKESGVQEAQIGTDERRRVPNTSVFPWRAVCSLRITAADGSLWIGTGWFAGPRLVMTAGHCVHMADHGGWVRSIEVIPGRDGATQPFGSSTGTKFRSVGGWTQEQNSEYDYGAVLLPDGTALGTTVGYFELAARSDEELRSYNVNLSGYPSDKQVGTQWWDTRIIDSVTARIVSYQIDTYGGQSGAPVWVFQNQTRTAVGIHTNGSASSNSATRITQEVLDNIRRWKSEAGQ